MRVLIANLTLLCQCVFQWWVVTALAVLFVLLCLFPDVVNAEAVLAALLLVPLGLGMAIASLQDAVTSRVGLFCLPRPQGERRRLALLLGSFAAFCAVLVFIGYVDRFDVPPHRRFLVSGSIFAASLLLCCSGAAAPLLAGCLFIGGPMILHGVISLFAPSWPSVSTLLELAIIDYPGSVIAMSMVATAFSWVWLARPINDLRYPPTRPSTKRNATQRFFADVLDKAERKDAIHPWINAVLLERMRRSPHTRTAKHVWSSLYLWLHPRGGGRAELILGIVLGVVLTVVCWYADFVFLLVLGAMILFEGHRYALHSPLMTIGGRRERFLSTMVQLAVSGGVFALSVIVSFAALDGLQGYLPGSGTRALHAELDLVSLD